MNNQSSADIVEDFKALVYDAESLLEETASYTGDKIVEARGRAEESLRAARAHMVVLQEEGLLRFDEAAEDAKDFVQSEPFKAVAIAAGLGFFIGLILHR